MLSLSNHQQNHVGDSSILKGVSQLQVTDTPVPIPKVKEDPLPPKASVFNQYYSTTSLKENATERDLVRELIYAFQGIDGQYISYDPKADQFVISKHIVLPKTTVGLVSRLLRMAFVFRQIKKLLQMNHQGLYQQSFISSIQDEVQEYYRLLAVLESQLDKQGDSEKFTSEQLSLKRLYVWTTQPFMKMRILQSLLETCQNLKGGQIITAVHKYAQHGDPLVKEFIQKLLQKLTVPFYTMVHDWIYQGELNDPYDEFFVAQNDEPDLENQWSKRFSIREAMLPSFVTPSLAKKVFLIGKSLHFIRHSCNDSDFPVFHNQQKQTLSYGDLKKMEISIDRAYKASSKHLLHLLLDKFKLLTYFRAIKKYILLSQGDFVQCLMDSLGSTLSKPATSIYRHNLTGTLESAIRSSNAQYDDPEILKRLDVRLLDASGGETGWDIFVLDYHTDAPCNTVLNTYQMHRYHSIFAFLWKLKRVEHSLLKTWASSRLFKRGRFCKAQIVLGEMIHFINQLQRFVFEVVECVWTDFMAVLEDEGCDLDKVIEGHNSFVDKVITKSLVSSNHVGLLTKMFETMYKVVDLHEQFVEDAENGMEDQASMEDDLADLAHQFQTLLQNLMTALAVDKDPDVQFLATRWNFNQVYGEN